ncbi:DEAD/DEAH box helicase [Texcoconibacillus texcoconensis]|uniref:ATP-dependent RNA helicase DbpA n=1 Tax=Texcoconibacillus texcoconensis TaxID=1095777 RepID=A0A840QR50_9BACI|nr:DEAD/DEAH box helicase [Texcoconibacillus texcoconensis]MBB5173830.1 superfamily II DNA/RNA helicase [Texcoconibacillus texcoconensis]
MDKGFIDYKLSNDIQQALADLAYEQPTEVQRKVIPRALKQADLVVKSQTGSGKTASFAIPTCELIDWEENRPQALVLTPTRELAAQVQEDFVNIGRYKRVKATAIFGKQSFERQKLTLKQKNHIVVGTPGRVLDHIQKNTLPVNRIKYLVIDEADEMLNMGFIEQVEAIIEALPEDRVTSLFSATIPEDVEHLCRKYMKAPENIEVASTGITTDQITHSLIEIPQDDKKISLLKDVTTVENPDSCIVFCNTKENVDQLYRQLKRTNYSCEKIHGGMSQEERFSVMNKFKRGKFRYLIATDVAARGIDIADISLVINYDIPYEKESYVHRTGRTGRAGHSGKAITFMTPRERKQVSQIEQYVGFYIPINKAPSKASVAKSTAAFKQKMNAQPSEKKDKSASLNKNIMKLYFNGGKQKKLRPVDFVGTLTSIPDVTADDIGVINIQERATYVDILNGKGEHVLQAMKQKTIKGKQLKVHPARE